MVEALRVEALKKKRQRDDSLSTYAQHRKQINLPGATAQAVSQAVKRGRLRLSVIMVDGVPRVTDFRQADREWASTTNYARQPQHIAGADAIRQASHDRLTRPMPLDSANRITAARLAELLQVDVATIPVLMRRGLAAALVAPTPAPMFDQPRALRFWNALSCPELAAGRQCRACADVLWDCGSPGRTPARGGPRSLQLRRMRRRPGDRYTVAAGAALRAEELNHEPRVIARAESCPQGRQAFRPSQLFAVALVKRRGVTLDPCSGVGPRQHQEPPMEQQDGVRRTASGSGR